MELQLPELWLHFPSDSDEKQPTEKTKDIVEVSFDTPVFFTLLSNASRPSENMNRCTLSSGDLIYNGFGNAQKRIIVKGRKIFVLQFREELLFGDYYLASFQKEY